jgi:SpoVK/Ycf46/Vps4 family AAA+-type ATPase
MVSEAANAPNTDKKYRFKELKVYASTEWLADNKKKYRQVFDAQETAYIYAELSFYNKFFDVDFWEVNVGLKCYSINKGRKKEICHLTFKRKVSKYDPVVYIREGWGNKNAGTFWKKGSYYWEAWIDGERESTKFFYIEQASGIVTPKVNPYFKLQSLKLYEGPYDDVPEDDRVYYKIFSSEESRYIYAEMDLVNVNREHPWQCELFIKFYNGARELKGQVVRLQNIRDEDEQVQITAGWGSNIKGSWRAGFYTAEVIFMEHVVGIVPFEVGEEFIEGASPVSNSSGMLLFQSGDAGLLQHSFDELMIRMDQLIGLSHVKDQIRQHMLYIQFLNLRRSKGIEEKEQASFHSVFAGNPGTGKTTIAKMMGALYHKMGVISKGHVVEVDRVDLVGEYIGQTAPKVKEAIEKARGGVLFIDEAYALARTNDDTKDFGREVIEILVKEMGNGPGDLIVIVAGYPKEMKHFLESNPGLKSRFKLFYDFEDYLPQELIRIADFAAQERGVLLSAEARVEMEKIILEAYRKRDKKFGNARFVHDLVEKAKQNLAMRIMYNEEVDQFSAEELSTITAPDMLKLQSKGRLGLPDIPIDDALLKEGLGELEGLIGMDNIKKEILELIRLIRYYKESGKDVLNAFSFHTLLVGNPGTGKTTIARLLTKLYKALGILERGQIVETDRHGLVAGFVGQTALKTAEKIDEAEGGVLFIDEAYALVSYGASGSSDYGNEAIQTLLKRMEDDRGRFFVFAAGYPDNMESFVKSNPGLASRFDKTFRFEDYSAEELFQIGLKLFIDQGYHLSPKAQDHLKNYLQFVHRYRDKYFGNARLVRSVVQEVLKQHHLRLSQLPVSERKSGSGPQVTFEDVRFLELNINNEVFNRNRIGFKK